MRYLLACLFLHVLPAYLLAQDEALLVPVTPAQVFGAHGSVWQTELVVTNMNPQPVKVYGYYDASSCNIMCSTEPDPITAAGTLFLPRLYVGSLSCGTPGRILWTASDTANLLALTLRTRDTSRDALSWGAIVPVVRRSGLFDGTFAIVDVPMEEGFRSTLRLYDVDPSTVPEVMVRYFRVDAHSPLPGGAEDVLLLESAVHFSVPSAATSPFCPAYAEVHLSSVSEIQHAGRIRIEVTPLDGRQEYWGFVSVTNNHSQEVSIVSPN